MRGNARRFQLGIEQLIKRNAVIICPFVIWLARFIGEVGVEIHVRDDAVSQKIRIHDRMPQEYRQQYDADAEDIGNQQENIALEA